MARFIKIHDTDFEKTINLEKILYLNESEKKALLENGETIVVRRQNEWNKVMSFVRKNEE